MEMDDPRFVVPYRDPYDTPLSPSIFSLTNPTLADLSNNNHRHNHHHHHNNNENGLAPLPQQIHHGHAHAHVNGVQVGNPPNHPFSDPMIQDHLVHMGNYFPNGGGGGGSFEAGPSHSQLHGDPSQPPTGNSGSQNNNNDAVTLCYWPELPLPFTCSCCQVLREIIHTNGITFTKLEIHGRIGMICHAIQHQNISGGSSTSSSLQYQMIDFCMRSIQEIKHFLVQYCVGQNSLGYVIMQDPMSAYYEALCTGFDWAEDLNEFLDFNPNTSGGPSGDDMEPEADNGRVPRVPLAAQRERAGKMKLSDFSNYFHLPIEEAAKQVNLCPTVVKKICRKAGLARWPHRKVKSIVKQITVLRRTLNSGDSMSRARTEAEISRLEEEMKQHCGGVAPSSLNFQ